MSSWSEPQLAPPPAAAFLPFVYADPWTLAAPPAFAASDSAGLEAAAAAQAEAAGIERERRLLHEARLEGRREAEQQWIAGQDSLRESERRALTAQMRQFEEQRRQYFDRMEREVVQLALAIARRVVRRESQLDPLLLAAAVRAALDRLATHVRVSLCVPPSQAPHWRELIDAGFFAQPPVLATDEALEPDGCRVDTDAGSADLSPGPQLDAIERGLLELLEQRVPADAGVSA